MPTLPNGMWVPEGAPQIDVQATIRQLERQERRLRQRAKKVRRKRERDARRRQRKG